MASTVDHNIHWHDSVIREVRLLPELGLIEFHLDYPVDWESNQYEPRVAQFLDAYGYKEFEAAFDGCPTALDMSFNQEGGWLSVRVDTNAGYRQLYCKSIRLLTSGSGG